MKRSHIIIAYILTIIIFIGTVQYNKWNVFATPATISLAILYITAVYLSLLLLQKFIYKKLLCKHSKKIFVGYKRFYSQNDAIHHTAYFKTYKTFKCSNCGRIFYNEPNSSSNNIIHQ